MVRRLPPVFLSIVIPAYNEEARINGMLEQLVVVSSGSAFAALSEVSLSSVKAQETINAGLAEVCGALGLKGQVIAKVSGTTGVVNSIEFQVLTDAGVSIDLTLGNAVLKYRDKNRR